MKKYLRVAIVVACIYAATGGNFRRKKQGGPGISFVFPGLNLLTGGGLGLGNNNNNNNNLNNNNNFNNNNNLNNNNNFNNNNFNNNNNNFNGGNIFGLATFTRTIISTVSTITTASFRTCTSPIGALAMTPCVGRRKREADIMMASYNYDNEIFMDHDDANNMGIEPSASIALIVGSTTITDQLAVSEYLAAHQPSSQSIIYPPEITIADIANIQQQQSAELLYPSSDSPDQQQEDATTVRYEDDASAVDPTTEISFDDAQQEETEQQTTPELLMLNDEEVDKARVGLGKTTTVTTVIRVTSVATTLASGTAATLQISYLGCLPPSLPVSGVPC